MGLCLPFIVVPVVGDVSADDEGVFMTFIPYLLKHKGCLLYINQQNKNSTKIHSILRFLANGF
jgi:hypothetical protein